MYLWSGFAIEARAADIHLSSSPMKRYEKEWKSVSSDRLTGAAAQRNAWSSRLRGACRFWWSDLSDRMWLGLIRYLTHSHTYCWVQPYFFFVLQRQCRFWYRITGGARFERVHRQDEVKQSLVQLHLDIARHVATSRVHACSHALQNFI